MLSLPGFLQLKDVLYREHSCWGHLDLPPWLAIYKITASFLSAYNSHHPCSVVCNNHTSLWDGSHKYAQILGMLWFLHQETQSSPSQLFCVHVSVCLNFLDSLPVLIRSNPQKPFYDMAYINTTEIQVPCKVCCSKIQKGC